MLKAPEETFSITKIPDFTVCTQNRTREDKVWNYGVLSPIFEFPCSCNPSAGAHSQVGLPLRHR